MLPVRIVKADLVHEDAVKADGLEIGGLLDGAQVLTVAVAQGEDGASGPEGLLPEVGKRVVGPRVRQRPDARGRCGRAARAGPEAEEETRSAARGQCCHG